MKEKKPNSKEFLEHFAENNDIELTVYQKNLARAILDYRVVHFSGGRGSGRTMVINAVNDYFKDKHPCENNKTIEE